MKEEQTTKRETTSIKINPELWKRAKIEAISKDLQLSDLVEQSLSVWMELLNNKEKGEKILVSILRKRLGIDEH